jgi:hypothetical protein
MATTYTVCFCGTACSRDEGERTRSWDYKILPDVRKESTHVVSDKDIYDEHTGYIPVRIHLDISDSLEPTKESVTVRGAGENDWYDQDDHSEPLLIAGPLAAPRELRDYAKPYSGGNQGRYLSTQMDGWDSPALALHAANLAASSDAEQYNFIGHSRGAVEAIMAAWFLYAYGGEKYQKIPINIFAIDPVPGTGDWYGILTQLPPNVSSYVGVYAWDHLDEGFSAVVPRPNARMTGIPGDADKERIALGGTWKTLADSRQLTDPIDPRNPPDVRQPQDYKLYVCRGRHGTVAGNVTSNGKYEATDVDPEVSSVPRLVYKLARAYLTRWETVFRTRCRVKENARQLRKRMHTTHSVFDDMATSTLTGSVLGNPGATRTSSLAGRPFVRRISSIHGRDITKSYYMEDVVGDPPYRLVYPCTIERSGGGWVKWTFL